MRRPHHRAPLRTTVLFHGALHPHGLFQSVLMGLDASYTGHEAKYPSVSRFEVFIAGLAILSSAHLSLLRTALRFNGKSRKTIGGIDANRFHSLCFPSISLLFFYYFFFFFDYSDIRIEVSFCRVCIVRKLFSWGSFCLLLERGEGEREIAEKNISSIVWWNETYFNWNMFVYFMILKKYHLFIATRKGVTLLYFARNLIKMKNINSKNWFLWWRGMLELQKSEGIYIWSLRF